MKSQSFVREIFGDAEAVKRLYIREFKETLARLGMFPEEFDARLRAVDPRAAEWPTVREMLADPNLFTPEYNQLVGLASLDDRTDTLFQLTGTFVDAKLREYLSDPQKVDVLLSDFQSKARIVHISVENPVVEIEKALVGEPLRPGSPNHISREEWALIHLSSLILEEVGRAA